MRYQELNLKEIRIACELDFAHYTYKGKQCSCCYGPTDMATRYWRDGIIKESDYTYILFKNAHNGSGTVTKYDEIEDQTYISYDVKDDEQLNKICDMLQKQLGSKYIVVTPPDHRTCIVINKVKGA